MAGLVALLRQLHRMHRHVHDLREQLQRLPFTLKAQKARLARQEEAYREAQDALKHLKVATHEKEVTLKTKNQQIAKYEKQREELTSKKEFDALQLEINAARQACQKLEYEILASMMEADEKTAALPAIEKASRQAREEFARFEETAKEREADLKSQLAAAEKELKEVEKTIPDEIRPQYQRITNGMGADGLSVVIDRTCKACSTGITAQNYNDLL